MDFRAVFQQQTPLKTPYLELFQQILNFSRNTRKNGPGWSKIRKISFFSKKKKTGLESSALNLLKKKKSDPRPEMVPKNYFPGPPFSRYVGFQWLLRKHVLKIGHYLET